jgi:hypothetical protein
VVIAVVLGAGVLGTGVWAVAWQSEEEDGRSERVADNDIDPEQLERRLDELQELIKRAEQQGDRDRVREHRAEGERILDRLEEFERSRREDEEGAFEREEWEAERRELEMHRVQLEIERLHLELTTVRQESAGRLAELAMNKVTSASYAIQQAVDNLEEVEAREFLTGLLEEVDSDAVQRIIRHHMAQLSLHMDEPEEGLERAQPVAR